MRIASLHTYPVKGGHRLDHDRAAVEPWGLAGDRRWMVVDPDGVGITQRTTARLTGLAATAEPGGLVLDAPGRPTLTVVEPADGPPRTVRVFRHKPPVPARLAAPATAWLSAFLDRPARLAWLGDPATARPVARNGLDSDRVTFADSYPLLLTSEASLAALGDWLIEAGHDRVPMTRFRPNAVVTGATAWSEDGWIGHRVRIGDLTYRAAEACARCLVTTIDQETGDRGHEPLRTLGRHRRDGDGLRFGVNLIPDHPGVITVGDPVHVQP